MNDSTKNDNDLPASRKRIPGSSIIMATFGFLIVGFAFTVGCTIWSLTRAGEHPERELEMALLWLGVPLLAAGLLLWGAAARYRAANRANLKDG
ncbi:MAG: hypothetical protein HZB53_01960 [Chloroflexi bacterium]|nr:hypothetical protein [Chloroflexota bacterium]